MSKEKILAMDRTDLVLSVQGYITDPAINVADLDTRKLREILFNMYHISFSKEDIC